MDVYKRPGQPKWQGKWKNEHGQWKYKSLCNDKGVARQQLAKIIEEVERRKAGLSNQFTDAARLPIGTHLADYRAHLEAKGSTKKHVGFTIGRIEEIIAGCGFKRIPDLESTAIASWLQKQRADKDLQLGHRASNARLTAIKGFSRWLWENSRSQEHRLVSLKPLNLDVDHRHSRRSLTDKDLRHLLAITKASTSIVQGLDGRTRWLLYLVASLTGLRASEIATLKVSNFDFQDGSFFIQAKNTKAKKSAVLGLHQILVIELQSWIVAKQLKDADNLFNLPAHFKYAKMLKHDLEAADIPYCLNGRIFDFHALRGQCATMLERAGVSLKKAQEIMRHSTPSLTSKFYSRPDLADMTVAINSVDIFADSPNLALTQSA